MKAYPKKLFVAVALLIWSHYSSTAFAQNLFVSDGASGSIYEYTPKGTQTTFATNLNEPEGLAFDSAGNLYVAELPTGNIYKYTPAGVRTTFGHVPNSPNGLAFDSAGNLYVANNGGSSIYKFFSNGTSNVFASGLNGVNGLAFGTNGNLFAAEADSYVTDEFDTNGAKIITSGILPFYYHRLVPTGLACDSMGNLFVAANYGGYGGVYEFTNALNTNQPPGTLVAAGSGLISPVGVAFDSAGNLYVADSGNGNTNAGAIYIYAPNGSRTIFATNICPSYISFGPASASSGPNTWYVWTNSLANGPGTSWANAFHDIQSAVNAANNGDTVLVTNGIYSTGGAPAPGYFLTNRVCVTNSIILTSVNGPGFTIITGGGVVGYGNTNSANNIRCVYLGGTNAVLSGFTLSNGFSSFLYVSNTADTSGGGIWCPNNGIITNCEVLGNFGGGTCGGEGGTYYNCTLATNGYDGFDNGYVGYVGGVDNATLYNCTLVGNVTYGDTGGAASSTLYNCTLQGNFGAVYAGGATACTLYNCIISSNTAAETGENSGGVNDCTAVNCQLVGNINLEGSNGGGPGGAISSTLINCLVAGNTSVQWAGGALWSTLINCTVVSNSTYSGNGNVGGVNFSLLTNCIIFDNYFGLYTNYNANYDSSSTLSYSCAIPLAPGIGNVAADPQFVNPAAGNFQLMPTSPCLYAGYGLDAVGPTDLAGNPRFGHGSSFTGLPVDMGAYEFQGDPASVTNIVLSPVNSTIGVGTNLQFTAIEYFDNGTTVIVTNGITSSYWASSNTNVAAIAIGGIATGVAGGVTTITVSYLNLGSGEPYVSSSTLLTVAAGPVITLQPTNNSVSPNGSVTLSVSATGGGLSYQWQLNGTNIAGATGAAYTIAHVASTNVGVYTVVVSNQTGSVTSQAAIVGTTAIQMFAGVIVDGPVGTNYVIQSTANLNSGWITLTNLALPSQPYIYIDYNSPTNPQQFYRAYPQ